MTAFKLPLTLEQQRQTCELLDKVTAQAERFGVIAERLERRLAESLTQRDQLEVALRVEVQIALDFERAMKGADLRAHAAERALEEERRENAKAAQERWRSGGVS